MSERPTSHFDVIKAINSASKSELRAIAGVESAVKELSGHAPAEAPSLYNPRKQRRAGAASDFAEKQHKTATRKAGQSSASEVVGSARLTSPSMPVTVRAPVEKSTQDSIIADKQLAQSKQANELLAGLYQDSKGYWRQQSGAFATRQQKEAIAGKKSTEDDDKGSLVSRAMSWIKGKLLDDEKQNEAVDAAGVATAGSEWLAFKEIKNLTVQAKEMLQERGLDSKKGIKEKASRAWTIAKNPIKWMRGGLADDKQLAPAQSHPEKPTAETSATDAPIKQDAGASSKRNMLLNVLLGGRFGMAKAAIDTAKQLRQQRADKKAQEQASKPVDAQGHTEQIPGKNPRSESLWRRLNPGPLFSHIGRRAMGKFTRSSAQNPESQAIDTNAVDSVNRSRKPSAAVSRNADNMTEALTEAIAEQTEVLSSKLDRVEDAVKGVKAGGGGGGSSLLGDALDLFGNRRGRSRNGKKPPGRFRRAAGRVGSKLGSLVGMGVSTAGAVGLGSVGASAGTAAASAGTAAKAAGTGAKFGLAGAAKAGGAVLSKLALPLTAAMAVYDGFKGFTDTEKQKETFKLKEGQDASFGQKSAMAAGSILSLGGLTDYIGLSGSDMASGIYKLFGGEIPKDAPQKSEAKDGGKVIESQGDTSVETGMAGTEQVKASANPAPSPIQLAGIDAAAAPSPFALTSFSTAPVQSPMRAGNTSPLAPMSDNAPFMSSAQEMPPAMPPVPADIAAKDGSKAPTVNVIAQTDPKILKALEKLGTGNSSEVVSKSKETIRHQSERVTQQIPTGLSDNTMRMIAMDLL